MLSAVAHRHAQRRNSSWLGCCCGSGTIVPTHLADWRSGTVVPFQKCRSTAVWLHRRKPLFPQQVQRRCVPSRKTRRGTTSGSSWSVLVMLYVGILHSVAACPVGRHKSGDSKTEHLRPHISPAA